MIKLRNVINVLKISSNNGIYLNRILTGSYINNYKYISSANFAEKPRKYELTSKDTNKNAEKFNLSESDYLVRLKHDPDVFGEAPLEKEIISEEDLKEEKYLSEKPTRKLRTKQYADIIKDFIKKGKIKEAIDVLEIRMIKEDRVKPENYIYNLILGACGRVGYTKKAFRLYNDMKKRQLKITGGTYTALFNACSNSPWPEDGLSRARHLREIMIEKQFEPNLTNYHVMIKAFGRCGDLETAFSLVDEMQAKNHRVTAETINFLLQACISDPEAGFRHALLVWRKFFNKKITPNQFTFNLLLRSVRDCGLGDIEVTKAAIEDILKDSLNSAEHKGQLLLEQEKIVEHNVHHELIEPKSVEVLNNDETKPNQIENIPKSDLQIIESSLDKKTRPNLLAATPHLGNIVSISEITKPEDRLLLLGGFTGFLQTMEDFNCTPNIKTFTQLLDTTPSNLAAEQDLMKLMKKYKVKPDLDFFNMLIRKRALRCDYENGKKVLDLIEHYNLRPNLVSYGVLALGCKTKEEATELLDQMSNSKYRINVEILGAMLKQACFHLNFSYVLFIMDMCVKENVEISKKFLEILSEFKKRCRSIMNDKEKPVSKSFQKNYLIYKMHYRNWLNDVKMSEEDDVHPWQQFRQTTEGDSKFKSKEVRFKPKRLSKFRVKTSTKHRK